MLMLQTQGEFDVSDRSKCSDLHKILTVSAPLFHSI